MEQWEPPPEEETITPPSSEAITTPVTRTVMDESENFFSAFLPPVDIQAVNNTQVVSVPPTKSQRRPQQKDKKKKKAGFVQKDADAQESEPADDSHEMQTVTESQTLQLDSSPVTLHAITVPMEPALPASSSDLAANTDSTTNSAKTDDVSTVSGDTETVPSQILSQEHVQLDATDSSQATAITTESKTSTSSDLSPSLSSKEVLAEHKDLKAEDRQSDTPSPPVSAFSSGTSTTSDIEVLDHESVLSESSASSRQETGEGKPGLHLMQGSFQLLTASTCADFSRLEDYSKLTESCGSSSDAFERIDSFSVQSLDSRSVSEVNSDDEIPGSRTLASVTAGSASLTVPSVVCKKQEDESVEKEEEKEEEGFNETMTEKSVDEMEESGRSATPVNSEQPEELTEEEQGSEANVTLLIPTPVAEEQAIPPITEDMKSFSTVQILELQKVPNCVLFLRSNCSMIRKYLLGSQILRVSIILKHLYSMAAQMMAKTLAFTVDLPYLQYILYVFATTLINKKSEVL